MSPRKLLREPVVQFALIGFALFLLHGWVSPGDEAGQQIVVSQARVDDMAREYRAQLGRSPTQAELSGLVDTYVHDEILYREGMSAGLGRDDPVVRRRVLQKYEIILEEAAGAAGATEADLQAWLKAHPADFARPATVTFEQIYFDTAGAPAPADVERRFEAARRAAVQGGNPATLGDDSMLPRRVERASADVVARDFGPGFAEALAGAPVGRWFGPVASGYGAHLVRVTARAPAVLPPLDEVRGAVARDWEGDRRRRSLAANYESLRGEYDVAVKARLTPQLASRQ